MRPFNGPLTTDVELAIHARLLHDLEGPFGQPGFIIIDNNWLPGIDIVDFMELRDFDYKLVSPARTDITKAFMPTHCGLEMTTKWLGTLELLKDIWDEFDLPERKKFEIPPGQHISDIIVQIMQEPIPIPRPADKLGDSIVVADADADAGRDTDEPLRHGHHTDNRIVSNTHFRAWLFSFSSMIVNSPYSQTKSITRTKSFFSWLFVVNVILTVALAYVLYNIVLDYEEFIQGDVPKKRAILSEPSDWVEESPFYIWTTWLKKLVKLELPYAGKRRQVSEELLDTVEKWMRYE
ncbi:hypothetical protein EAF04_001763 [Stromatinia cepivora]|nr:hypothetical protein EAF04_001763 [Stromatinia cepivora]